VVSTSSSPAVVGFLDRNYQHKSVTQFLTMVGWHRSPTLTYNSSPFEDWTSIVSLSTHMAGRINLQYMWFEISTKNNQEGMNNKKQHFCVCTRHSKNGKGYRTKFLQNNDFGLLDAWKWNLTSWKDRWQMIKSSGNLFFFIGISMWEVTHN
jgi:hypothetical protein